METPQFEERLKRYVGEEEWGRLSSSTRVEGASSSDEFFARALDRVEPLRSFRQQFLFPNKKDIALVGEEEGEHQKEPSSPSSLSPEEGAEDSIYLCGNSLGLQPKKTREYVLGELDKWHKVGVEGHFSGAYPWLTIDEFVHEKMAKVVGALPSEVAIMNSLSTNIHLLMVSFYRPTQTRFKIIIEKGAFPSDLYIVNSQAEFHGFNAKDAVVQLTPREGEHYLRTEDIISKINELGESLALVLLSGVQYYSGQFFEIPIITQATHKVGAISGWDLAHAVGNLPVKLHDWDVDFACWCTYKYLNSGPGSIGGAFVHERHGNNKELPRFAGWWGHDLSTRFQMDEPQFQPIPGAFGWRLSNPPVLPVVSLLASLELFEQAGIEKLREKSMLLTGYLRLLLKGSESAGYFTIITPKNPEQHGCQLSLLFAGDKAQRVFNALKAKGIVCDLRKPNVIRVSPTPLYNSFTDVWQFVETLKSIESSVQ